MRGLGIVGGPVLGLAQQHVPGDGSLHAGQETTVLAEEGEPHLLFGAEAHQRRTDQHVAETHDAGDGQHRHPQLDLLLDAHHHGLGLEVQVGTLGGDEQRVQVLLHGSPFRQAAR
jgi:hypothetical protein